MANECYNQVHIKGDVENIASFMAEIAEIKAHLKQYKTSTYPSYILDTKENKEELKYMFDFDIDEILNGECLFSFTTKWTPATNELVLMAKHHKLDFVLNYDELGDGVYGEAIYNAEDDTLAKYDLDSSDLDPIEYNSEEDEYLFEGKSYESQYDILQIIFDRKFNAVTADGEPAETSI